MENSKSQMIFLTVIAISTLIVASVGATFAWFSVNENKPLDLSANITNLGVVSFTDGAQIDISSISKETKITKNFTISQSDKESTSDIEYLVKLNINSNTIPQESILTHSLTSSGNQNNGSLVSLDETTIPNESIVLGSGVLKGYETHNYEYTLELKDITTLTQDNNFNGYLSVEFIKE